MHLFYTPNVSIPYYTLAEQESKHCVRVLRLTDGDHIYLTDGRGQWLKAEITDAHPKHCQLKIVEQQTEVGKRPFELHIAIAPTKSINRFEWFLEKATEIGIDKISPIVTRHSERKQIKTDRLNKVIEAAMKQSQKAYHPQLNSLCHFTDFIENTKEEQAFIAHCQAGNKAPLSQSYQAPGNALILIGPEGDFSPEEIQMAQSHHYKEISLGDSRLRTETAGIVACHTIHLCQ